MNEQLDFAPCGYASLSDDGIIESVNQTLLRMLKREQQELVGSPVYELLTKPSQLFYQHCFYPLIRSLDKVEEVFLELKHQEGHGIPFLLNAGRRSTQEGTTSIHCVFVPMKRRYEYEQFILEAKKSAERKNRRKKIALSELDHVCKELEQKQKELLELNHKLEQLAITDELTGLHNRRSYKEALFDNISEFSKTGRLFSLLMLDIDYFKNINDNYGHLTGDRVLKELALLLSGELGQSDIAARYGGEEFALILPGTSEEEAVRLAEQIRQRVASAAWCVPRLTVSIGIATAQLGDTVKCIQARADEALYHSKHDGRNRVTHAEELNTKA